MYGRRLRDNLPAVREAVAAAAERAGRAPDAITVVAVTKAHPVAAVSAALEAGLIDVGENRVHELEGKVAVLGRSGIRWHMIGHVQSRKAAQVAGLCDLLHSVDSLKLARRLSRACEERDARLPVLVQVNASGEAAKSGLALESAREAIHEILELPGVYVRGLMTMAAFVEDEAVLRRTFGSVRELHQSLRGLERYEGVHVSMGMTNDYTIAVEEGSTLIRLGTALFGARPA